MKWVIIQKNTGNVLDAETEKPYCCPLQPRDTFETGKSNCKESCLWFSLVKMKEEGKNSQTMGKIQCKVPGLGNQ